MSSTTTTWEGSLHQSFRLIPSGGHGQSKNLRPFLQSEGRTRDEVLAQLPYEAARSRSGGSGAGPDPKRYRDGKQVYQTVGLLYEGEDRLVHVTDLGRAALRWLDLVHVGNAPVLGRHAAYALARCQLRNPGGAGKKYDPIMEVFPNAFIWRAMLDLDDKISSDELNRAIFKTRDETSLGAAIDAIAASRESENPDDMGPETITESTKNDRIVPWISAASFGYTLIADKREDDEGLWYRVRPNCRRIVAEAARVRHTHREFTSVAEYVRQVSTAAALPEDVR